MNLTSITSSVAANTDEIAKAAPVDNTLTAGMADIQSGAAFTKSTESLSSISSIAATLPDDIAAPLIASQADLKAKMDASVTTLSRDVGVAKMNIDLQNKLAFAASGFPATDSVISAAAGPTAVLSQGPKDLINHALDIAKIVGGMASKFGVVLPVGVVLGSAAAAALVGAAMKSFNSSIPAKTIPNPDFVSAETTPTIPETITNPAYTAFAATPANTDKVGYLSDLSTGISSMSANASAAFGALQESAAASLSSAISNIKASSTLSLLTTPAPAPITAALNNVVDYSKIDVEKVQASLNVAPPPIPTSAPGSAVA